MDPIGEPSHKEASEASSIDHAKLDSLPVDRLLFCKETEGSKCIYFKLGHPTADKKFSVKTIFTRHKPRYYKYTQPAPMGEHLNAMYLSPEYVRKEPSSKMVEAKYELKGPEELRTHEVVKTEIITEVFNKVIEEDLFDRDGRKWLAKVIDTLQARGVAIKERGKSRASVRSERLSEDT